MKLNKLLQVGLISAFSTSSLLFTSCDGGSSNNAGDNVVEDDEDDEMVDEEAEDEVEEDVLPEALSAGDTITIQRDGEDQVITILTDNTLDIDSSFATYTYTETEVEDGKVLEIKFVGFAEGQDAVDILNLQLADPNSLLSLARANLSDPPTVDEMIAVLDAVADSNIGVTIDFDDDFNFYIAETFGLALSNDGSGSVPNGTTGTGFNLMSTGDITLDGALRFLSFEDGTGFTFTPAE